MRCGNSDHGRYRSHGRSIAIGRAAEHHPHPLRRRRPGRHPLLAAGRSRRRTSTRWRAGGTRFEYCYSTPLCGPSRCELLTGRYPFRTGLISNQSHNAIQPGREIMIPTVIEKGRLRDRQRRQVGPDVSPAPASGASTSTSSFPAAAATGASRPTYYTRQRQAARPARRKIPARHHAPVPGRFHRPAQGPAVLPLLSDVAHPRPDRAHARQQAGGRRRINSTPTTSNTWTSSSASSIAELDRQHLREKTLVIFTGDNGTARFGAEIWRPSTAGKSAA